MLQKFVKNFNFFENMQKTIFSVVTSLSSRQETQGSKEIESLMINGNVSNLPLNRDVMVDGIGSFLPLKDLESLATTCKFFSRDAGLNRRIIAAKQRVQIAPGGLNTLVITAYGLLFDFRTGGQPWVDNINNQSKPQLLTLPDNNKPKQVTVGTYHALILCEDDTLFSFGSNEFGQLGMGGQMDLDETDPEDIRNLNFSKPQLLTLPEGSTPKQIAAGYNYNLILCESGIVFSFGHNSWGQLGLGHTDHQSTPQRLTLPENKKAKQIIAGETHSLILCDDNSLFSFGCNELGQLGYVSQAGPDGNNNQPNPQLLFLPEGKIPKQIVVGTYHTAILSEDNLLFTFGFNGCGQLGCDDVEIQSTPKLVTFPNGEIPIQIAAGERHTLVLCKGGFIFGFGSNEYGELGLDDIEKQSTPKLLLSSQNIKPKQIVAKGTYSFIICEDGSLLHLNNLDEVGLPKPLNKQESNSVKGFSSTSSN